MEDLLYKIHDGTLTSIEDIMAYADDILILCTSIEQLKAVINVIRIWSTENNLHLNPNKSGIIEFRRKYARGAPALTIDTTFEGIPVVSNYKFLGTMVDQKLTVDTHLDYFTKRVNGLAARLFPLLKQSTFSFRRHLWNVLARPLYEQLSLLAYIDTTKTGTKKVERAIKKSFKRFTLLQNSTKDDIVIPLMDYDYAERSKWNWLVSEYKWERRMGRDIPLPDKPTLTNSTLLQDLVPGNFSTLVNLNTRTCPKCPNHRLTHNHRTFHNLASMGWEQVINTCRTNRETMRLQNRGRSYIIDTNTRFVQHLLDQVKTLED